MNYIDNLDDKVIAETRPIVQFWCQEYENKEEKVETGYDKDERNQLDDLIEEPTYNE